MSLPEWISFQPLQEIIPSSYMSENLVSILSMGCTPLIITSITSREFFEYLK